MFRHDRGDAQDGGVSRRLSRERQSHNLALTVLYVPYSLDSGASHRGDAQDGGVARTDVARHDRVRRRDRRLPALCRPHACLMPVLCLSYACLACLTVVTLKTAESPGRTSRDTIECSAVIAADVATTGSTCATDRVRIPGRMPGACVHHALSCISLSRATPLGRSRSSVAP